ncbi:basic leucine zipper 10-like isoform X1 [Salvia splendens]|uniref:basic leucine zipper 10-like isoform X1 n=2 Tax=Salvia splendens TaxID=180675 RepID=UPI001C270B20|nr:basic leucine zipper 10-like isoform X1 [Salvia splendens]
MLLPEIEAAEALAALARSSSSSASCSQQPTRLSPEDQAVAASHENNYAMATISHRDATTKLGSNRLNSATKLRRNLTQAEKEAQRIRRILANRESARQTVRRRQAMHTELTRQAVDLAVENENLKKEKELAVEAYNSLKNRNKFLKLQADNSKKAESQEPKSSQAEKPITTSSLPLYNHPSLIPFSWPTVLSSNFVHYQYPSHSDPISLSEHKDISSTNLGPETSSVRTGPGNLLIAIPLPWVLPLPSYGPVLCSCSDTEKKTNETHPAHQCSKSSSSDNLFVVENNELSSKSDMLIKDSTCVRSAVGDYPVNSGDHCTELHSGATLLAPEKLSCIRPTRNSLEDETGDPSAMENVLET